MSIVSEALDRRRDVLNSMHLLENPFVKTERDDHVIDRIFVGREPEMLDAAMRVVDRPRNILVQGGYGYGKTTFVRKLLRELRAAQKTRFLAGYAPLRHNSSTSSAKGYREGRSLQTPQRLPSNHRPLREPRTRGALRYSPAAKRRVR